MRTTEDLDLFIRTDEKNSIAICNALAEFGAPLKGMTPSHFRDGSVLQIGQPPERVDIMQRIEGISFDEAWPNRVYGEIDNEVPATVISKEDFMAIIYLTN